MLVAPSLRYDFVQEAGLTSKSFFSMPKSEAGVLLFLVAFSALSFLPAWRTITIAGMAAFGWLMAALMVVSPALALFVFLHAHRSSRDRAPDSRRAASR